MVLTASSAYVKYGYESTYGGGALTSSIFGKDQKISGLTWMTNQQEITQLYTPEIQDYVYGKNEGKCSLDYTLSNPWIFSSIFNSIIPSSTDTDPDQSGTQRSNADQYWTSNPDVNPSIRMMNTSHLEFGYDASVSNVVRNAKGVITTSIALKTAINDKVTVSQNMVWGNEDTINTTISAPSLDTDSEFIPYMFHHATLELPSGSSLAQVQDLDITFDTGAEQYYNLGSPNGVDAYRKLFKISGKFSMAVLDASNLQRVVSREVQANMKIVLSNNRTGTNERSITINCERVGLGENTTDYEPGEPVIEGVPFQIGHVNIEANNNQSVPSNA